MGGVTAQLVDELSSLGHTLPWMALVMCLATFVLLFLAFGSVVLPLKAIVMNVLSLAATFGVIVWIFQEGHLSGLLRFTPTGTIDPSMPILMLAIIFGLSMDYEVFLLSRIRERYDVTGDNTAAVASGLQRTGGLITSLAFLLVIVVGAFSASGITFIKLMGVGMIVALVVDATLVRILLVPATMRLLGRANWWAPGPLRRVYRRYGLREEQTAPPEVEPVSAASPGRDVGHALLRQPVIDGEDQGKHPGRASLAEQPGRDRHRPAAVDAVVDDQHRAAERGDRPGQRAGQAQFAPDRLEPLRAVELLGAGGPHPGPGAGITQGAQQGQPADLRDPLAQAGDELGPGVAGQRDHAGRALLPVPRGQHLDQRGRPGHRGRARRGPGPAGVRTAGAPDRPPVRSSRSRGPQPRPVRRPSARPVSADSSGPGSCPPRPRRAASCPAATSAAG